MKTIGTALLLAACLMAPAASADVPPRFVKGWGNFGGGPGQFNKPIGIAVNSGGDVYVADYYNNRIQKFTGDGTFVTSWGREGNENGEFYGPIGIDFDAAGNVYVSSYNSHIQKFSPDGTFLSRWPTPAYSTGIAIDANGDVYLVDQSHELIRKYSPDGDSLLAWGSYGTGNGQFRNPNQIAIDAAGNVYVTESYNERVQKFSSDGVYLGQFGRPGNGDGQFNTPAGIDIDPDGNILVVDSGHNRIQKFSPSGQFLCKWGTFGNFAGAFSAPTGVAVDALGNIFIADKNNHRVQKYAYCPDCPPVQACSGPSRIFLHVTDPVRTGACEAGRINSCADVVTEGEIVRSELGPFYFAYLLVFIGNTNYLAGLQCGITYESGQPGDMSNHSGIDIFDWTCCGTMQFPTTGPNEWPRPGGGNMITWSRDECQSGTTAVAGYFYMAAYSQDILRITPRPVDGEAKVANCFGTEIPLSLASLGYAAFSPNRVLKGCNPTLIDCEAVIPIQPTTWSSIKTMYSN